MLKRVIISVFILFSINAIGQQFKGGIDGGIIGSQVTGDLLGGFNKAGVKAGGYVSLRLNDLSSVQMELNFIQKGSRKNPSQQPDSTMDYSTYLLRLNYIEMPLHYRYQFRKTIMFEGGISMGVLVNAQELRNGIEDMPVPFKKYDLSWEMGVFYEILEGIQVNLRYSYSILAVRRHNLGQSTWNNKGWYNEILGVTLYYEL
jgi:hypothetical protein